MKKQKSSNGNNNGANLGFEQKLWLAADKLRSNMDAAEYKHVVLGLIFLKYISDAFNEVYEEVKRDPTSDPEDTDEYLARRVFWVPKEARWDYLQKNAKQPEIGELIDNAMELIEKDNPSLKGVLVKNYARPGLNKQRLGELIDLIGTIGLGDKESKSKDILGRVYEYFLGQFADAEGKKGGQFYTPRSIVKLLVEMLEPYRGRIFDPCCGSGGMFVQSEKFIEAHGGKIGDISIFGQESNQTTWRLCKMNLAIRGIDAKIEWGDSFRDDQFKDLKADFILANPEGQPTPFLVVGQTVKATYSFTDPYTGDDKQESRSFVIRGIMAQTGNPNIDRAIIISPEIANSLLHKNGRYDSLMVVVPSPDDISTVQDEIKVIYGSGVGVSTPQAVLQARQQFTSGFSSFILAIALVALVVGAVGIVTTLYTSVTERIREIGTIKAIGALNKDILLIFISEASIIGVMGATLGLVFGIAAGSLMTGAFSFGPGRGGGQDVSPVYLPTDLLYVWGLSVGLSLMAGIYPAWKASRLEPIVALRRD